MSCHVVQPDDNIIHFTKRSFVKATSSPLAWHTHVHEAASHSRQVQVSVEHHGIYPVHILLDIQMGDQIASFQLATLTSAFTVHQSGVELIN